MTSSLWESVAYFLLDESHPEGAETANSARYALPWRIGSEPISKNRTQGKECKIRMVWSALGAIPEKTIEIRGVRLSQKPVSWLCLKPSETTLNYYPQEPERARALSWGERSQ